MEFLGPILANYIKCRQRAPPPPVVHDGPLAGPGGGGKMCSGTWKCGPQSPVGVISLCHLMLLFGWCIAAVSIQSRTSDLHKFFIFYKRKILWMGVLRLRFLGEKSGEKGEKIIMEKKAEIFSIFISAFSPYNREYWDSAFYGRKRRKSGYFFHIHFRFFSISGNEYGENMEKKRRMNMEKLWTSIKFSITFSIRKWRMNMEKSWTSIIFSIMHIERNTSLQKAWSLTWITPIIKPEIVNHIM